MNLLHGPAIADLCDYDFGDQAGCLGGVSGAFMKDANESNLEFIKKVNGNTVSYTHLTLPTKRIV